MGVRCLRSLLGIQAESAASIFLRDPLDPLQQVARTDLERARETVDRVHSGIGLPAPQPLELSQGHPGPLGQGRVGETAPSLCSGDMVTDPPNHLSRFVIHSSPKGPNASDSPPSQADGSVRTWIFRKTSSAYTAWFCL